MLFILRCFAALAYISRGFAYNEKGDYDQAIADYDQALLLKPKDAVAYNNRGAAYNEKGDYDQAIADYNQALRFNLRFKPKAGYYNNRGFAYCNRGDAYRKKRNYDQALGYYKKANDDFREASVLRRDHATSYLNMGELCDDLAALYLTLGKHNDHKRYKAKAIEAYDNTVRLCPNYETDFVDRDFAYGGKAAVEKAVKSLESKIKGIKGIDNPERDYYEGVISLFINDRISARRCFELAEKGGYNDGAKLAEHLDNLED